MGYMFAYICMYKDTINYGSIVMPMGVVTVNEEVWFVSVVLRVKGCCVVTLMGPL